MHNRILHSLKPHLPLLVFLLPVVSINLAYVVASLLDHVPRCVPYLSGCTSISSAGRVMPQKGVFLLGMVPAAILSMQLWLSGEAWFAEDHTRTHSHALVLTGALASFCLLAYVTTLGIPGDIYRLIRKIVVLLYFGCTFIAQLLLIRQIRLLAIETKRARLADLARRLTVLCTLILACGIVIVPISLIEDPVRQKQVENIVEWNYALFLHVYYLVLYPAWRKSAELMTGTPELKHGY